MGSSGGTLVSSRWNPTKEQISMLESLYGQGIRTPSAEQIQQITRRLRVYGHIEGKNVFYWFQNHKARQRHKQKQERMAFIDRHLHKAQPVFPLGTNVVCGPYYLPQNDLGFYPQCNKVLLPGGSKRRARTDETEKTVSYVGSGYDPEHRVTTHTSNISDRCIADNYGNSNQETLPLFPLHPTEILQGRTCIMPPAGSNSEEKSLTPSTGNVSSDQPFLDFFSGRECENSDH